MLLSTFLAGLGGSAFSLLFNLYLLTLGYQADFVGLLASVTTLSTALTGPLVFTLSRRLSPGSLLAAGFVLQALGGGGQAIADNPPVIIAFAIVLGTSQGFYWAPLPPFLAENSALSDRSQLFSVNIALQLVAGILGYALGGVAPAAIVAATGMAEAPAYRATLLLAAAVAGVAFFPAMAARSRAHRTSGVAGAALSSDGESVASPGRSARGTVTALGLSALSMGVAAGLAFPFFNVYFATRHAASTELIGAIFAASSVIGAAAVLVAPLAHGRLGYVRAIASMRAGAGAGLLGMALAGSLPAAVASFAVRNVSLHMMSPLIDAFGMTAVAPQRRVLQAAVTSALWHAGYGLTSLAAGVLIVASGFEPTFLAAAVICGANAVLFWLYFRKWRPAPEA